MASWEGPKIGIHAHDVPAQILRLWSWNVTHMAKQPDKLWTLQLDPGETRCSQINFTDKATFLDAMLFPVTQTSAFLHSRYEGTASPNISRHNMTKSPQSHTNSYTLKKQNNRITDVRQSLT